MKPLQMQVEDSWQELRRESHIYVFVPVVLMILTLIETMIFPVGNKEFDVIKREIARRKGESQSKATPEEIAICEKVTGFSYDRLWNKDNAFKMKKH